MNNPETTSTAGPAEPEAPKGSFLQSPLLPIFLIVLVDVFGLTLIIPLLPAYAKSFGATDMEVGFIYAAFAVCQFIAGPIIGRISDRVGRRPVLIVSQLGTFVGFLILGAANTLALVFLSRIIDGLTAGNLSIAQAYISDVTKPSERTKAFGLIGIAFGAGFLLGPAVSGFLSKYGYHVPAFLAAGMSLTSVICTATLLPKVEPMHAHGPDDGARPSRWEQFSSFFSRPEPRTRLLEFFLFIFSFSMIVGGGFALFMYHRFGWGPEEVGYIYAFSGLVGGLVQGGVLGRLVKRLGEERLSTLGFITMGIGYSLVGFVHHIWFLLITVVLAGFGSAVTRPALTTLLTKSVGPREQGAVLGVSQSVASVAQILGPIVAGWLIQHELFTPYGFAAGALSLAGALFGFRKRVPSAA
jgi:MFS family permease